MARRRSVAIIKLIAAISLNGVIAKDNKLPWSITSDMKVFKEQTIGHNVVMGRKTFDSIGMPLLARTNWVLTTQDDWKHSNVFVAPNITTVLNNYDKSKDLWVIGGATIYNRFLANDLVEEMYITHINQAVSGDNLIYFPTQYFSYYDAHYVKRLYNYSLGASNKYEDGVIVKYTRKKIKKNG